MPADIIVKQAAKAFGDKIGGLLGGAIAAETVAFGIFVREAVTLYERLIAGVATGTDVRSATVAFEAMALGAGVVLVEGGVITGIGTVAGVSASIPLTAVVIGIAAACVFYEKKGSAIDAAVDVLWDGISKGLQPWNIFPAVYDAYAKESKRIDQEANEKFRDAQNFIEPKDPLVLDLDGDGIEAVGINPAAPILFDMDGDGIKTATGWIKADDGMLVLDRNGNGLIDSGRELFGDATILTRGPRAGQTAANGYEALADLDINGDGVINSLDAAYASLRIWQDANQDGISQASELRTLSSLGIASLNVTGQASNINLGNGNTQPFSGSFTRTNGSTGASGVAEVSGSLLLAENNFYTKFPYRIFGNSSNAIIETKLDMDIKQSSSKNVLTEIHINYAMKACFENKSLQKRRKIKKYYAKCLTVGAVLCE